MKVWFAALASAAFLAATLPGVAADSAVAKRDDSASEKLGIKLSMQCYTYRALTFFETVDKAVRLGVKYLEIYPGQTLEPGSKVKMNSSMDEETIAKIKKKLADAGGIKLVAYGVASVPNEEAAARKVYDWAKKMGISVLVTETTPNDVHDKLCREYNIRFALHNHPRTWPPEEVLKASKGHTQLIGSCSDTGHWMRADFIPVEQMRKLKGRIEHLHFKDLNNFGKDDKKAHDLPWGTGKGDVQGMLTELKTQGYKGYLSIEYEYGDVKHLDENLPKCVAYFDKVLTDLAK
jgi:sugar phosphate isomerase/epimerase